MVKYTWEALRKSECFSPAERDLMTSFEPGEYTLQEMREMLKREMERTV